MNLLPLLLLSTVTTVAPDVVLLDFTAKWCGPCQQISPIISRYIREGYRIEKIDVDQHRDLATKFQVSNIPCFVLLVNGKEAGRVSGANQQGLSQLIAQMPKMATEKPAAPQYAAVPAKPKAPVVSSGPKTFADDEPQPAVARNEAPRFQAPLTSPRPAQPAAVARTESRAIANDFSRPVIRAKFDKSDAPPVASLVSNPMASSVRIRIRDKRGINFGSGTIIDSRPGRSTVLTCGHVFRGLQDDSVLEVDLFRGPRVETFVGTVVRYNMDADVGLLVIPTETPVAVSPIAAVGGGAKVGDAMYAIGCGGGEEPRQLAAQVTSLDKYLGPPTIECTGVPQQGRSGEALFNADGQIVGICSAANTEDRRGLYCGLKPIHDLLDLAELTHLYRRPEPASQNEIKVAERGSNQVREMAATTGRTELDPAAANDSLFQTNARQIEEIRQAMARTGAAEVVCIIRPIDAPESASRVVVINRASAKFLSYLDGEMAHQPQETAMEVAIPAPSAPNAQERYRRSDSSRR